MYMMIGSVAYMLAGYLTGTPKEQFNFLKFLRTMIIGFIVGYVEYQYSMTFSDALAFVSNNAVFTALIDQILIGISQRVPIVQLQIIKAVPASQPVKAIAPQV
jgi:hypothetical protein